MCHLSPILFANNSYLFGNLVATSISYLLKISQYHSWSLKKVYNCTATLPLFCLCFKEFWLNCYIQLK